MVRVDRTLQGPNGEQVTVIVEHEAGRHRAALYLLDEAVASVTERVRS